MGSRHDITAWTKDCLLQFPEASRSRLRPVPQHTLGARQSPDISIRQSEVADAVARGTVGFTRVCGLQDRGAMPTTRFACLVVTSIALLGISYQPWANACSGMTPGQVMGRQVFPSDGATGVPTNARVVLVYRGTTSVVVDHPRLTTAGGGAVAIGLSQPTNLTAGAPQDPPYVLAPTSPLQPNTQYTVLSDYAQVPCVRSPYWQPGMGAPSCIPVVDAGAGDGGGSPSSPPSFVIATFTTGAGPDNVQPLLSGDLSYSISSRQSCDSSACCGPYDGFLVSVNWSDATDSSGSVLYELSRDGAAILFPIQNTSGQITTGRLQGAFFCSGSTSSVSAMMGYTQFVGRNGTYQIVAVDVAGNRSAPLSVAVSVDCGSADAGVDSGTSTDTQTIDSPASEDAPLAQDVAASKDVPYLNIDGTASRQVDLAAADQASAIDVPGSYKQGEVDAGIPAPDTSSAAKDGGHASPDAAVGWDKAISDSGCSCRMGGHGDGLAGYAIFGLGVILALRARRRRR